MPEDFSERDALIAKVNAVLNRGMAYHDHRGGPAGLLSDLLFACGYPMTPKRIRAISSARHNPACVPFARRGPQNRKKGYAHRAKPV